MILKRGSRAGSEVGSFVGVFGSSMVVRRLQGSLAAKEFVDNVIEFRNQGEETVLLDSAPAVER
jgi:hypothetical protein